MFKLNLIQAEMECDSRIMEVNSDIVNMVKQQDIK